MRRVACALWMVGAALAVAGTALGQTDDIRVCNKVEEPLASAVAACTRLIGAGRLSPAELATVYTNRGTAHRLLRQYDRALQDQEEAVRLNPRNSRAWHNRGVVLYYTGKFDLAIESFGRAIAIDDRFGLSYENRGFAYFRKGQFDRAIADYDAAAPLLPGRAITYYARGLAWRRKGDAARAAADIDAARKLQANVAAIAAMLGLE